MARSEGAQFLRFAIPIIEALKYLGGSASASEVTDLVIERMGISKHEESETTKSGRSRVRRLVANARMCLVRSGHLGSSQRGIWSLTEKGQTEALTHEEVVRSFRQHLRDNYRKKRAEKQPETEDVEDPSEPDEDYRTALLSILLSLPPDGFERICQRLLRESGFQQVTVTGKSGDGGIDGHGILEVNPLVSFKVLFQCKRYQGAVSTSVVRDFRGAMQGRADKGIILTTGSFTTDAKREAIRDGATPVELVDGEKLLDMFASLQLGLTPRQDYDIDAQFFEQFRK